MNSFRKNILDFYQKADFTDFMFCLNTFSIYFAWKDNIKETVLESLGLAEK